MHPTDVLNEYNSAPPKKSRFYYPLIVVFGLYLLFIIFDTMIDIRHLRLKVDGDDWMLLLLLLILPLTGMVLFVRQSSWGWAICHLFFLFFCFFGGFFILYQLIEKHRFNLHWRNTFMLGISISSVTMLVLKETRAQLKVPAWAFITTFLAALIFACVVFYLTYFKALQ
ncbi:MAG: hypothetical protein QM687_03615 [Ferruginibacter sp.]